MINVGNKKGFTLIELLSVLVLIGLLFGLAIPGINKISNNMKKRSLKTKIKLVEQAGVLWGQDNKTRLNATTKCFTEDNKDYNCFKIKIDELINQNYLDSDNNSGDYKNPSSGDSMIQDCVYVYKKNNRVYAKYNKDEEFCNNDSSAGNKSDEQTLIQYTLTYDANGGNESPPSIVLNKDDPYGELPTPTRDGYTFEGWYTEASGGNKVTPSTTIDKDTIIYAHWTEENSVITYRCSGELSGNINGSLEGCDSIIPNSTDYYLKLESYDNSTVSAAYVCTTTNNEELCLKGSKYFDPDQYIETLNKIFGSSNCNGDAASYSCTFNDGYKGSFLSYDDAGIGVTNVNLGYYDHYCYVNYRYNIKAGSGSYGCEVVD